MYLLNHTVLLFILIFSKLLIIYSTISVERNFGNYSQLRYYHEPTAYFSHNCKCKHRKWGTKRQEKHKWQTNHKHESSYYIQKHIKTNSIEAIWLTIFILIVYIIYIILILLSSLLLLNFARSSQPNNIPTPSNIWATKNIKFPCSGRMLLR